jgi:DNA-binding response OmpR family regulator
MSKNLLIVDDDQTLLNLLNDFFTSNDFAVTLARDGVSALACYGKKIPDLLLIDLDMPQLNGFEVVEKIREDDYMTPIILMTGSWLDKKNKIRGYELGAIQFLEKPVELTVLLAQINCLLSPPVVERKVCGCSGREYHLRGQVLTAGDSKIEFREREARILAALFERPGEMVSRKKLQIIIWDDDNYRNNKSLDNLVYQVKKKLEPFPELLIRSAYSRGYVLEISPNRQ